MTFNLWTFLFQTLNFVVLAFILQRLLYRPLQRAIERRREAAARVQAEAEAARLEAVALEQRLSEQLADLDRRRQDEMRKGVDQAEAQRQKLLGEIERTAEARRVDARQALEREREDAIKSLRDDLVGMAVELAERLLREACDSTLHRQLTGHLLESLARLPEHEQMRLRTDWQSDDGAAVETADDLDLSAIEQLRTAVASLAGRNMAVSVQKEPTLLSGIRLRIGGHVWDASLAGRLAEARNGSPLISPDSSVACLDRGPHAPGAATVAQGATPAIVSAGVGQ